VVLGRTFKTAPNSALARDLALKLRMGQIPTAMALTTAGSKTLRLRDLQSDYVAGSSTVVVAGKVSSVDSRQGRLTVGKVTVDYTSVLTTQPRLSLKVGDHIRVSGTQPLAGGSVLASELGR
jgi:hypothetical protein